MFNLVQNGGDGADAEYYLAMLVRLTPGGPEFVGALIEASVFVDQKAAI